nr:hypothetical protein [Tanacetum cinerariifolium]
TMDDVNLNAPADQAPTMTPPTRTDNQILPHIRWVPIGKINYYLDIESSFGILFDMTKRQSKHKFHPRPDSPLHLPNEEPVLGYLNFSAKGTKREVFGMPIPGNLITADIQGSDPDSPAPKPTKATKKSKPSAPKIDLRPPVTKLASSRKPEPKPAPAKYQGKKRKLVTETSDKPSLVRRSKLGLVTKRRKPTSSLREPESGKYQPLLEVQGKGKKKVTDEQNNWASALASTYLPLPEDSLLMQTGDMTMFIDWLCKRQGITKLKPQDLEGSAFKLVKVFCPNYLRYGSNGTRPALSISKIKAAYYPNVGLEKWCPIRCGLKRSASMRLLLCMVFLTGGSKDNDSTLTNTHLRVIAALEKSMNRDHTNELLKDLAEARNKKKKRCDSPKMPPGSLPHQPPPPLPPAGPYGTSRSPKASGSSQVPPPPPPPLSTNQEDLHMDDDMALDAQVHLSDDEDIRNAYIPKNNWASALASTYLPSRSHRPDRRSSPEVIRTAFKWNPYIRKDYRSSSLEMVPDQMWIEEECKYEIAPIIEVFSMYGYDYMKKIVLRRADLNEHIIAERDFKYPYPSNFEDLYLLNLQGHLNHLPHKDKKILTTAVNLWTRHLVIRQRLKDFQLGIESYQTQVNLTKPRWDSTGFEYKHDYTVIDSPRAIIFQDRYGVQMIMRFNEI